ncbi:peptidyl-tRNA hydrolase PTH2 [Colletotrichum paranaense]|uniref:peptidyl-tRNA hydrolase n=4 Tax=Colletotrichum acutatum species complex TaxID=2707335 RepID=A0AAI9Z5H0_9PEZI|nr:peptidyl-tRNA hydrolase PTH2 [Colletotrichum costaricense]XP_060341347.1 peptidyl-tRNA hydrolase PTH2 [Colletotrichum paranaense]KAK0374193.1 peptidyl-tRNA hydrolase PTH2 [Colletotrichum limetticola]KAK1459371.1 peptidyl-tRNA hydrolase PTH2 [Colletotrichum melonis]KAK1720089.1 peptidyl-tRNA hydrolase PTH2 [Colletotrichum lupini]KAK1519085.1 peptidyl-tRNA hydrolase PTH2 [Colletotrichum paranaense]KAK1534207.1 peptidyl-tRNA hydrolase PTH2 [Colletotrichum costaricense]
MADTGGQQTAVVLSTSIVALMTGFLLGVYSIRGYLISPELRSEARANFDDPVESEESDIDEDDTVLDHAPNWANGLDADRRDGLRQRKGNASEKPTSSKKPNPAGTPLVDNNEECKLVLVVRTDLGMTKGKMAAQASHATLACYKSLSKIAAKDPSSPAAKILSRWENLGQAKIAVQIKNQDEMLELMGKARSLGVTSEVIADAGRTQIEAGSLTVLGVGPAPRSLVDQITGHLKLL